MAKVPNGVETLPEISIAWVGCTNVTDDRQTTDGRTTTYSEREREFANNKEANFCKYEISIFVQFYGIRSQPPTGDSPLEISMSASLL